LIRWALKSRSLATAQDNLRNSPGCPRRRCESLQDIWRSVIAVLLCLGGVPLVFAQGVGTIGGSVVDKSGAVLPGVTLYYDPFMFEEINCQTSNGSAETARGGIVYNAYGVRPRRPSIRTGECVRDRLHHPGVQSVGASAVRASSGPFLRTALERCDSLRPE
jgi:hypothetical protein